MIFYVLAIYKNERISKNRKYS